MRHFSSFNNFQKRDFLPRINWRLKTDNFYGTMLVDVFGQRPTRITTWMAESTLYNKRDFRMTRMSKDGVVALKTNYRQQDLTYLC